MSKRSIVSRVRDYFEPVEADPKDKADNHEVMRLAIMVGVIATVVAGLALLFSGAPTDEPIAISASTTIVVGVMLVLAILSFSYIMLTGLFYSYPSKRKKYVGLPRFLESLRQLFYRFTVYFYWISFFLIIYYMIAKSLGISYEQSLAFLNNTLTAVIAYCVMPLSFLAVVINEARRGKNK